MTPKKTIGLILVILGTGMTLFSTYIASEVAQGQAKIDRAQSQVDKTNSILSVDPTVQQVGKVFTGSAQKKIDQGSEQVAKYQELAKKLKIGGVTLLIVGGALFLLGKRRIA